MTTTTHQIAADQIENFKKVVARANKKATKLGTDPFEYTISAPMFIPSPKNVNKLVEVVQVTLTGATPALNGWKLTGVIAPLKTDTGAILPLVTTVPGEAVSDEMRATNDVFRCDHCNTRRDRLETFVVQHEDGSEKQVGRNCVADFLGGAACNSATGLAALARLHIELNHQVTAIAKTERTFYSTSLEAIFAVTLRVISKCGWVSVGNAMKSGKMATKVYVSDALDFMANLERMNPEQQEWHRNRETVLTSYLPTELEIAKAKQVVEAVGVALDTAEEKGEMNEYLDTCRVIHAARAANRKALGIACSMVNIGLKALGEVTGNEQQNMLAKAKTQSMFVGTVGVRQSFQATICDIIRGPEWTIRVLVTPEGNVLKTFTNIPGEVGTVVNIKGTPVKYNEYKGVKETVINRVVVNKS